MKLKLWLASALTVFALGLVLTPDFRLLAQTLSTIQPVSGTFWQTTQPVSLASAPTTAVTGTFWQATQPVSGTFWQTTQPVSLASAPTTAVTGTFYQITQPVSIAATVTTAFANADPCKGYTKSYVSFNQTSTTQILGAAGAGANYYICSIDVLTATAQNVGVIDSATAGNACATSPAGSLGFGGSTAATGWNFAANGGIAYGNGDAAIGSTSTTNHALCIAQSSTGQVSGGMSYVTH
jgi:hypothetical protein